MRDLGRLFGKSGRADSLIAYTKEQIASLPGAKKTALEKVYFMWAQGPLETSGTASTVNELIQAAGAINVCPDPEEHLVINVERLIKWNPDVIVMWHNEKLAPANIMRMGTFNSISAVRTKRVYELPSVFYCDLWTLKFQYAIRQVSLWCYPSEQQHRRMEDEQTTMMKALYGESAVNVPL